jgi:hypothetical protein
MFTVKWTPEAANTYNALREKAVLRVKARTKKSKQKSSKDEGLFKQVHKTIDLLRNNPRHPGLKAHEYDSITNPFDDSKKVFEAYAQNNTPGAYRVFWCYGPRTNELTIIAITAHP